MATSVELESPSVESRTFFKKLFPSLNKSSVKTHYIPLAGAVSHASFAVHLLNPNALSRLVSNYDLAAANALFFNSHIGAAIYLYYRPHMVKVSKKTRIIYCVYAATLFNFGSVLLWATVKTILPKSGVIKGLFGIFTSVLLCGIGREYLNYIDSMVIEDTE